MIALTFFADVRRRIGTGVARGAAGLLLACAFYSGPIHAEVLPVTAFARHIEKFNTMEPEAVANVVPNSAALEWLQRNIPRFECPDADVEEIYYFRWWALRKHLRKAPDTGDRYVFTEFITKPKPVSSALGHHLAEGRWLRDPVYLDDTVRYWLRGGEGGQPQAHLHKYSQWTAHAVYARFLVTHDIAFTTSLLEDLVRDYAQWAKEKQRDDGLFWQFDVWDAMEESISGSRTKKNLRPTINSYMFGNAQAISAIARLAGRSELAAEFEQKAATLKKLTLASLWDADAKFFKVRFEDGASLSDAREAIGFLPWYFGLPDAGKGYEAAWVQFTDPAGFRGPIGITTAERRHPAFRTHGTGTCEWDGAAWPFSTSQTLGALANVLRDYSQTAVTPRDYFDAFLTYVRAQHYDGLPYIGEYYDESTGAWLKGRNPRSFYYNHSTFADLLIADVVGLRPRADDTVEVYPLLPERAWSWFCLDNVAYHGRTLTILWDADGKRYGRGAGMRVFADGKQIAHADRLGRTTGQLP